MRRNKDPLSKGVNICFLAIGLLICLLATCVCAHPRRDHHRNNDHQHQQLQLYHGSMSMRHSRHGFRTTRNPFWRQRSRCHCPTYRNQFKDGQEEIQPHATEGPNALETTFQQESTANEQHPLRRGPHLRLYGRKRRNCYCPRRSFRNRKEQEDVEIDDIVQRQPYYLHRSYAHKREPENKLEDEISNEDVVAPEVDSTKEHQVYRRHYHWRHRHEPESDSDPESGEDTDGERKPCQHRHHFRHRFHHRHHNSELDENSFDETKNSNDATSSGWPHHFGHHHRHHGKHNSHRHGTDHIGDTEREENTFEGANAITTTTTEEALVEEEGEETVTHHYIPSVAVDPIITTPTTTPTADTVEQNTLNTETEDMRFGVV